MEFTCPYCRGSKVLRHGKPETVEDDRWAKLASSGACPLCKGKGVLDRPADSLILDTGLLFIKNSKGVVLVGCPEPTCVKWVDCTEFFRYRKGKFEAKCPVGHDVTIGVVKTRGGKP